MNGFASWLLSLAHDLFQPGFCPGDWVWATIAAGALVALFPVIGALIVSIMRKFTGNNYNATTVSVIAVTGLLFVFLLPWLAFNGISGIYRAVNEGSASGLSAADVTTLHQSYCFVGVQSEYLGGGQNGFESLFYPSGNTLAYIFYLGGLVGLPALTLLFMILQARSAMRRGQKWPGRLLWLSYVVFAVFSLTVEANAAVFLWLGFLPVSVLGLIPLALVGAPPWAVINRGTRDRQRPEPEPEREPARPAQPPPPPQNPQQKQYTPTAIAPSAQELAATPGPIPAPPGASANGSERYRRTRRLGRGGFGTVWQAVDNQLGRTVALKIAHAPDRDTEERMRREARALAMVNHPNCVRVYDLVEEPDGLALVMEYLDGQALATAVDTQGPLDDVAAGRLWATMAGALEAAHEKGVLHRDIKPSNIIVDPQGLPHLIDFGIARSRGDSSMTATGMVVGTPDFVAPEQAAGAPASPASDAWQLAATVSYALAGYPPRGTRETPMAALMAAARAEPPNRLPQRSAHARLLAASLDAEPRRRPTLNAIRREIEGWLARAGKTPDGPVTRVVPRFESGTTRVVPPRR
ncbi:serine/threonine-protein kinase [Amycolatopsis taiwanensis]|uniref:non-specific serine/threonine protein kinase n=1 Tax=Amycolatopsis taiwanensis TaxID=342230 RepID=A0A9W6QWP1_9PSEU|nr:serine/threonine-protein kinase [Amycolatopsis taiwanensis]GLY64305.1 serine/threonine protein kinase [Amycolatopsis taiwanensis]